MAENVLVVAESRDGEVKKITYEAMTAAAAVAEALDGEVRVAVLGSGLDSDALAADLGARGAETVYVLDDEGLDRYAAEAYAEALKELIEDEAPALVLLGATAQGRDLAPRLGAKLEVALASDITGLRVEDDEILITRPMYAGKVVATVRLNTEPALATIRPNTWPAAEATGNGEAEVEEVDVDLEEPRAQVVEFQAKGGERPELTEATIIVSGGRGMGGPENYDIIEELADALGAAVGASRASVDAGWRPHSDQVGQTGKTVSPQLYIAVGISGAIQHLAGMRTSKYIVAINKDPEAPIFKLADYGIVGDLFNVVPALTEAVNELKNS
ncbi:MAG: electron transfer flavoprotein subunit alpha/FixB family protein [Ardenticatenaceae bacterium]|nr:electron transfer flavoprotein subunit alpha/FixB family protein [Ardenticatenaceae bacterium]